MAGGGEREILREHSGISCYGDTSPIGLGPQLYASFNPIYFLKTLSLNMVTLWVRALINGILPPYQKPRDVTVISDYSRADTNDCELVSPEGTQEGKGHLPSTNHQTAATSHGEP